MKKRITIILLSIFAIFAIACGDPYACGPDDRDGDGDGRCNEGR